MVAAPEVQHRVRGDGGRSFFGDPGIGVPAVALRVVVDPGPLVLARLPGPGVAPGEELPDGGRQVRAIGKGSIAVAQEELLSFPLEPHLGIEPLGVELVV